MRAVIDTNVLVAGLLWQGPPHQLLRAARAGQLSLISSPALLGELERVLARPKLDALLRRIDTRAATLLEQLRVMLEIWEAPPLPQRVCRDPDDDQVLALALAAAAPCIISGDADLLVLHPFQRIAILDPAQALAWLNAGT